ncbi:hypothetical protein [Flavobacterium sp.]|uniref:hypothetical protein n=1 Tax=Flavobacterium sp. TaxID=239 RepID=UPI0039E22798
MLQVLIDPSMLTGKSNANCEITVNISGCAWPKDEPIPDFNDREEMMKFFYPWRWENPKWLKIHWFKEIIVKNQPTTYEFLGQGNVPLEITSNSYAAFDSDELLLQGHYESLLNNRLIKNEQAGYPIELDENQIRFDLTGLEQSPAQITIDDDYQSPSENQPNGFLNMSIAQFAQKLPPHNLGLHLTFFAQSNAITIPDEATHFVVYPVGQFLDDRWSSSVDNGSINNNKVRSFVYYNEGPKMQMQCQFTAIPLPSAQDAKDPIQLRDSNGNFLGQTTVEVHDSNELFDKQLFKQNLLAKTSLIFDLPALLLEHLDSQMDLISQLDPSGLKSFFKNANSVLMGLIRDHYSIGNALNEANTKILLNGVTFAEEKDPSLPKGIISQYNEKARPASLDLLNRQTVFDQLKSNDGGDLVAWRSMLKLLPALDKQLQEIELFEKTEADQEFVVGHDDPKLWLSHWKAILDNRIPLSDDTDDAAIQKQRDIQADKRKLFQLQIANAAFPNAKQGPAWELLLGILDGFFEYFCPSNLFIESVVTHSKGNDRHSQFNDADPKAIKQKLIETCLADYADIRIVYDQDAEVATEKLFPSIKSELKALSELEITTASGTVAFFSKQAFTNFIKAYNFNDKDNLLWLDIEAVIEELLEKPTDVPPQVLVMVDTLDPIKLQDNKEDLADEISGHLVVMQRSQKANTAVDPTQTNWKALNWSRVNLLNNKDNEITALYHHYLIPAFLPETDNIKSTYLPLSNERLSLIAGHDSFKDNADDADDTPDFAFQYPFENTAVTDGTKTTITVPPAFAFWYGYHYDFAGFVVLNSGVLPPKLRKQSEWVTPKIDQNDQITNRSQYKHYRRVPIAQPSSEILRADQLELIPVPTGLLPLACELPEWKAKKEAKDDSQPNLPVYLLFNNEATHKQTNLQLKVGKPLTNFWNWYAWHGDQLTSEQGKKNLTTVLENELKLRGTKIPNDYLHDPALSNTLVVVVEQLFPVNNGKYEHFEVELADETLLFAPVPDKMVEVKMVDYVANTANLALVKEKIQPGGKKIKWIEIPQGCVARVSVHGKTMKSHFGKDKTGKDAKKFHPWMDNRIDSHSPASEKYPDHFLTPPTQMLFEAAMKPSLVVLGQDSQSSNEYRLWKQLTPFVTDTQQVALDLTKNDHRYSYFSRTKILHQVWHWNGRLSGSLLKMADENETAGFPDNINPEDGKTNYAMKWEAWEFSDRPDFSALEYTTHLTASRIDADKGETKWQTLFTDNRPVDEKALYYRFSAELFGRYELLGGQYAGKVQSKITVEDIDNPWKRFLRLSTRTKPLPKPAIRFAIPLTASIDECPKPNEIDSASIMVVLNDRWFSEAGLAEKLEIGIELLETAAEQQPMAGVLEASEKQPAYYLNAGPDPILSGQGLQAIAIDDPILTIERPENKNPDKKENPIVLFTPEGPAGLTFDFAAATPKLIGSTFILKVNDINRFVAKDKEPKMDAWSMVQIAARRNVDKSFLKKVDGKYPELKSEWTAKEWVQFLPNSNAMIPHAWKKEHANYGQVHLSLQGKDIIARQPGFEMPVLMADQTTDASGMESKTEKYLVVSQKVYNAGGLPVETYKATYRYAGGNQFVFNDALEAEHFQPESIQEGYARIIMVRVNNRQAYENKSLWEMLFGENVHESVPFGQVQNDPAAALPLISKRISITLK